MSAVASELVHLEILPAEILLSVVQYLHVNEVKQLYGTSKRLREVCRPSLFAHVGFEFAQDEAQKLERLLVSSICKHVVLFTCRVKKRLRPVYELFDPQECFVDFMSFGKAYKELWNTFEKQNDTENIGPLLSNVFCALPCLKGPKLPSQTIFILSPSDFGGPFPSKPKVHKSAWTTRSTATLFPSQR
ncbi:hypothetical protein LMH87_001374 [Akanthomyces muscarius]|uniref:F-box domain-containing protein n=1 Tax=Akanthomyces muscarius TaxID=2231603 RepID=A0A9W8UHH5_AKAMU|nr:hypothetical protein LMH87_001374 [Akanthomyces muscarius]KAJ4146815.1 hypothetical protein LMH87_001374 [Akanthomyces muscarius]